MNHRLPTPTEGGAASRPLPRRREVPAGATRARRRSLAATGASVLAVFALAAGAVVALGTVPAPRPAWAQSEPIGGAEPSGKAAAERPTPPGSTAPPGKVRCPNCDSKGREKCPTCGGKGVIFKKCPRCDGTGERPCKVCNNEGENAAEPGRLVCTLCRGEGRSASGRACSRCRGEGTVVCGSCLGDGSHSCPKEVHDSVCPTCRFAGKIRCRTCNGERWVAPSVLRSKTGPKPAPKNAPGAAGTTANGAAAARGEASRARAESSESPDAPPPVDLSAVRARFRALSSAYESHYDVFVQDLRPEVAGIVERSETLGRDLRGSSTGAAKQIREEIDEIVRRGRAFPLRFERLYEIFRNEKRNYLNAKRKWDEHTEVSASKPGYRREMLLRDLDRHVVTTTRIAERIVLGMASKHPEGLLRDVEELQLKWKELRKRGEIEARLAAKAREAAAEEDAQKKRSSRRRNRRDRISRSSAQETRPALVAEVERRPDPPTRRAAPDPVERPRPRRDDRQARGEEADTAAPVAGDGGGTFSVILAALVGFAAASSVFLLRGFRRDRVED